MMLLHAAHSSPLLIEAALGFSITGLVSSALIVWWWSL